MIKMVCSLCKQVGHTKRTCLKTKLTTQCEVNIINEPTWVKAPDVFNIETYMVNMEKIIKEILSKPEKDELSFDILDTERIQKYKPFALKLKQRQMKYGEIWQVVIGNYNTFTNLKNGSKSGLDAVSDSRKIIAEIKNRDTTDCDSSKKMNKIKIARYKKEFPDYEGVYIHINCKTTEQFMKGTSTEYIQDNIKFKKFTGMSGLRYILGDDAEKIVELVKKTVHDYDANRLAK